VPVSSDAHIDDSGPVGVHREWQRRYLSGWPIDIPGEPRIRSEDDGRRDTMEFAV
jgi:hypothetical protein